MNSLFSPSVVLRVLRGGSSVRAAFRRLEGMRLNRQDAKNAKEDAKRSAKRFGKGKDEGPTLFDMEGLK